MKAFKLASGFAVSALTLAIAGTAVAEATTSVAYTGSVKVQSVMDFEAETRASTMPGYTSTEEDWYNFNITTTVTHGPMSGKIRVGIHEKDGTGDGSVNGTGSNNNGQVKVYDLIVTEGPISFGQISRITATAGLYESITDETETIGEDTSTRVGVVGGLRYTMADLGLKVQTESGGDGNYGFAAAIEQDLGVAKVYADAVYREVSGGVDTWDPTVTFGVGAEASPVDMLSLTAVFRSVSGDDNHPTNNNLKGSRTVFAAKASVDVSDTINVYGIVADSSSEVDGMTIKGGFSAGFAPITVSGSYEADLEEVAGGLIMAKVEYSEGAIGAYGEFGYSMEKFKGAADAGQKLKVGGSYTTESGVKYGADFENGVAEYYDYAADTNKLTAYAQYSF